MSIFMGKIMDKLGINQKLSALSLDTLLVEKDEEELLLDYSDIDEDVPDTITLKAKKRLRDADMDIDTEIEMEVKRLAGALEQDKLGKSTEPSYPSPLKVDRAPSPPPVLVVASLDPMATLEGSSSKVPAAYHTDTEDETETVEQSSSSMEQSRSILMNPEAEALTLEEIMEDLERVYLEDRSLVVRSDGFISTPLHALKTLAAKFNEFVHVDYSLVPVAGKRRKLERVELFCGAFRGVGEAFRQRLAAQMAAIDLIMRLDKAQLSHHVVPFAIYPGWRIKAQVCKVLDEVCDKNGLAIPRYITKSNLDDPLKPVVLVECFVGKALVAIGESDLAYVARKIAAQKAIERLTTRAYPLEFVALGSACHTAEEIAQLKGSRRIEFSDKKKRFLLEETAPGVDPEARGVDPQELTALEGEVYQNELHDILQNRLDMKITVGTGSSEETRSRKVKMERTEN